MDFQIPLIVTGIVLIASLSLVFVYKLTIKEKSYEEALAEQRQQNHALFGYNNKSNKTKDKKSKKVKKGKENKGTDSDTVHTSTSNDEADIVQQTNLIEESNKLIINDSASTKKPHVEFKEVEEIKEIPIKKKVKKEKVKPILINKEEIKGIGGVREELVEAPPANHFEELHPKDEFELLRSNSIDDVGRDIIKFKESPSKNKNQISPKRNKSNNNSNSSNHNKDGNKLDEKKEEKLLEKAVRKEKEEKIIKKDDIDEKFLQNDGSPTNGLIINNSGKEKKKKKNELQQQLGADKNGPNMALLLDWVRKAELSRSEVQILIDLLLNKQHDAPVILDEWSEGKSDPVQKLKKQLAEKEKLLTEEQEALHGAQAKLREIRAEQLTERSQLQQKIRNSDELLQNKQQEIGRLHTQLQQLQSQLNDELLKQHDLSTQIQVQSQKFEIRIAQTQENESVIGQLRQEIHDFKSHNQQLRLELQRLNEDEERNRKIIIQLKDYQDQLKQQNTEIQRKLHDTHKDYEKKLENNLIKENDLKLQIQQLNNVIQKQLDDQTFNKKQIHDELMQLKQKNQDNELLIKKLNDDKNDINSEEIKKYKIDLINLNNELDLITNQLKQNDIKYKQELDEKLIKITTLEKDLKEQKDKNNELRQKNWKVVEALNTAENRIKANNKSNNIQDDLKKIEHTQKEFITRLFPDIKEINNLNNVNINDFYNECEKLITNYITNLCKDKQQLESQSYHYKNAIDNTEIMLSKLQVHVQQEELNWKSQLKAKSAELETVKDAFSQLKSKLSNLEKQLADEEDDKNRIIKEYQEFRNRTSNDNNSTGIIEKLSEEVNRLREQLKLQQKNNKKDETKNGDINVSQKAQNNCSSTNGPSLIQYSSSSSLASSVTESVSVKKSRSRKKKKKQN